MNFQRAFRLLVSKNRTERRVNQPSGKEADSLSFRQQPRSAYKEVLQSGLIWTILHDSPGRRRKLVFFQFSTLSKLSDNEKNISYAHRTQACEKIMKKKRKNISNVCRTSEAYARKSKQHDLHYRSRRARWAFFVFSYQLRLFAGFFHYSTISTNYS